MESIGSHILKGYLRRYRVHKYALSTGVLAMKRTQQYVAQALLKRRHCNVAKAHRLNFLHTHPKVTKKRRTRTTSFGRPIDDQMSAGKTIAKILLSKITFLLPDSFEHKTMV